MGELEKVKPKRMSKETLVDLLRHMTMVVDGDDSMEGSIEYSATPTPNEFMVVGVYRHGNREGQGSVRLIGERE